MKQLILTLILKNNEQLRRFETRNRKSAYRAKIKK